MTVNLALEYIPRRMAELGYGCEYHLRFRHLKLGTLETIQLNAFNQLIILLEPPNDVRVESDTGVFDLSDYLLNEIQYEHRGMVKIINQMVMTGNIRFIQVIPKKKKSRCQ